MRILLNKWFPVAALLPDHIHGYYSGRGATRLQRLANIDSSSEQLEICLLALLALVLGTCHLAYARSADGQARHGTSHPNSTCNNARYAELISYCTEQVNAGKKIAKNWATAKNAKTAYYAVLRYKLDEGTVSQTAVVAATEFNEISDKILGVPHQRHIKLDSPRTAHHYLAKEVAMLLKHGKSVPPIAQQEVLDVLEIFSIPTYGLAASVCRQPPSACHGDNLGRLNVLNASSPSVISNPSTTRGSHMTPSPHVLNHNDHHSNNLQPPTGQQLQQLPASTQWDPHY